jgi:hypothetical protein
MNHRKMVIHWHGSMFMRRVEILKVTTIIKLGSMAFNVAEDEKVRQLVTMLHKGAKRRGLLSPPPMPPHPYAPYGWRWNR